MRTGEEKDKKIKITDPHKGLEKAMSWCAYQERCQQEVRDKLYEWGLWPEAVENIIVNLIGQDFLNEERFAKSYAGGKFRIKKWGLSDYCIRKGMAEIDEKEYIMCLRKVLKDYASKLQEKHALKRKYKISRYALSRGYEQDLIRDIMQSEAI
jgi:regulatory protein